MSDIDVAGVKATETTIPNQQWRRALKFLYTYLEDRFVESTTIHNVRGSFQKIAADMVVGQNAGGNVSGEAKYLAPIMGNILLRDDQASYSKTFVAINATERFTITAHGLENGDGPFEFIAGSGVLPTGVSALTLYWAIKVDADTIKVATTKALALAGTAVAITTDGTAHATRLFELIRDRLPGVGTMAAGVIGKYNLAGECVTKGPAGGVIGEIGEEHGDPTDKADGAVVAVIGGDSAAVQPRAMFAARMLNSNGGSGAEFGLDLKDPEAVGLGYQQIAIEKALIRGPLDTCWLVGAGAPSDGTTGDNFAGIGSMYSDITNGKLYMQTAVITSPVWKLVTQAA